LRSLEQSGLSRERMNKVRSKLNSLGHAGRPLSLDDVTALQSSIEEQMLAASVEMKAAAEMIGQIRATAQAAFGPFRPSATDPRDALAEVEERRATTEAIHSRLTRFLARFGWPGSRPIAEWIVEADTVVSVASRLQAALGSERVAAGR